MVGANFAGPKVAQQFSFIAMSINYREKRPISDFLPLEEETIMHSIRDCGIVDGGCKVFEIRGK